MFRWKSILAFSFLRRFKGFTFGDINNFPFRFSILYIFKLIFLKPLVREDKSLDISCNFPGTTHIDKDFPFYVSFRVNYLEAANVCVADRLLSPFGHFYVFSWSFWCLLKLCKLQSHCLSYFGCSTTIELPIEMISISLGN